MKVLCITMTIGEGLNKICRAVSAKLAQNGISCDTVNLCDDPKVLFKYSTAYYKAMRFFPHVMRIWQRRQCKYDKKFVFKNTALIDIDKRLYTGCEEACRSGYDVIFTPVSMVALVLQKLRAEGKISGKIVFAATDFNVPSGTELLKDVEAIVVPCKEVKDFLVNRAKLPAGKVHILGIPVAENFEKTVDKTEARRSLSLDEKAFYALYMGGGAGFGDTLSVVKKIAAKGVSVIVVNGRNQKQYDKIEKYLQRKKVQNVVNLGFCNNVDVLMSASDVFVTKTGMVSLAEAAAKKLPLVTVKQLLYPEYDNMLHVQKYGAGVFCKSWNKLAETLFRFAACPQQLDTYCAALESLFPADAAQNFAKLIANV